MDISVIIVNFNVKHFLEQCLYSLQKSVQGMEAEIIVIDNLSSDNSLGYLQPLFPDVNFVGNKINLGFGKACNQGLAMAKGRFVLFLNPDTIIPEDAIKSSIQFLENNPKAGGLGIRMVDGSGNFLKESKRSFPSPFTSLYKLFGLSRIFPRSRVFARYHLGHLDSDKNHEVDVLAGAFMLIRKEVLDKTGGFDEEFFMYGEDVDLSYRIQKAGYSNYYFSESCIIHFKGESTRRVSLNYVKMFYNTMSIFVRKHYGGNKAGFFNALLHLAIWVRASLSALANFIRKFGLPIIDAALILFSFWAVKQFWSDQIKPDTIYPSGLVTFSLPLFTILYLLTAYYAGLYDRTYKYSNIIGSTVIATLVVLSGYSLLPEEYRFSRGIILFGAILSVLLIIFLRKILVWTGVIAPIKKSEEHANTIIVGAANEFQEVKNILENAGLQDKILGRIAVGGKTKEDLGHLSDWSAIRDTIPFSEIIFCAGQLNYSEIIPLLPGLDKGIRIRFHAAGTGSIVGSDSKDSAGQSLSSEIFYRLADPFQRRLKRLLDLVFSFQGLLLFPVYIFIQPRPVQFFMNCLAVLFAKKTWIGYASDHPGLPVLRPAVIACNGMPFASVKELPVEGLRKIDYWYARDYELNIDWRLINKEFRKLGS